MSKPFLWSLVPRTDAVIGVLLDPSDSGSFYSTVTTGGTLYRVAHFVHGVFDANFASELPPSPDGDYVFTTGEADVKVVGARLDNGGADLVLSFTTNGVASDFLRVQQQGGTLYPLVDDDVAQNPDRTLKIIAPNLIPAA